MGISIWQLLIILAIVLVLFGAKRLRNVGTDLGGAIKGFKKAVSEEDEKDKKSSDQIEEKSQDNVFDVEAQEKDATTSKSSTADTDQTKQDDATKTKS